jgi:hypothetical protein
MPWHGTVGDVRRPLSDGHGIDDLALLRTNPRTRTSMSKVALSAEMAPQGALEHTTALNK